MRILIVSQYFRPEEFRINDLASGLVERGHAVTVLTGIPNYPSGRYFPGYGVLGPRREEMDGVRVVRVPLTPRGRGGAVALSANYLSFALAAAILGPFLCRGDYDAIFVYAPSPVTVGLPAILLAKLRKLPVFFWVQDLWPDNLSATGAVTSPAILSAVGRLVRFIYDRCEVLLAQSEGFRSGIRRIAGPGADIRYFPNSAESFYRPVAPESAQSEGAEMPEGFRVVFAGNIGAAQDFDTILAAAERLRDEPAIRWVILGDGRRKEWVEAEVARRGLSGSVVLLGRRPPESMPRYFAHADVLLATLRKDPAFALTLPAKVQSCLACGKPVVAALDGEGARVVGESGAGIVCPSGDAAALAAAVMTLFRMPPAEREAMGRRGVEYFEAAFNRDALLDRLEGWMADAAAAKPGGGG